MKKVFFLAFSFVLFCSFTSSSISSNTLDLDQKVVAKTDTNRTPVVFCTRGNSGRCDTRPDNQGFTCNPGGNECGGTVIKDIR